MLLRAVERAIELLLTLERASADAKEGTQKAAGDELERGVRVVGRRLARMAPARLKVRQQRTAFQ